jgi:hypothetical protein
MDCVRIYPNLSGLILMLFYNAVSTADMLRRQDRKTTMIGVFVQVFYESLSKVELHSSKVEATQLKIRVHTAQK